MILIRQAKEHDIPALENLLQQVGYIHHVQRPDIFQHGQKYTTAELQQFLHDFKRPILVAETEGRVVGYAFCIYQQHLNDSILTDIKTLYIDDLCVDEQYRGFHIGKKLYEAAIALAKENNCYNVTLNVWAKNETAIKFYQSCGLMPQKIGMEIIL